VYLIDSVIQLRQLKILIEPENMRLLIILMKVGILQDKEYQKYATFGLNISKSLKNISRFTVRNVATSIRLLSRVKKTEPNAQDVKKIK
tara:strand:- start:261 stop:527 length:267 start_codon:yes stop_codon:yes gene_type:complete